MIRNKNKLHLLLADLRAKYSYHELNAGFVDRSLDAEFIAIGELIRPLADAPCQAWTGYESAVGSEYAGKD